MKYKNKQLSSKQAERILEKWGKNKVSYAENTYGIVYWNEQTGEIMWNADWGKSNAQLLK